jgi:2-iminobutanoate/2-iminopropanoate deaminase
MALPLTARVTMRILTIACTVVALTACQAEQETVVQYLKADPSSPLPFSDAVRVGDLLFVSGQIGTVSGMTLIDGGIQAETRQTMDNIRAILERNGSSMDRVVKCLIMLDDVGEWGAMNEVYVTYFDPLPARSAMGADGLALGARVEIECIATVGT